jgi:hypothetical protein
VRPHAPEESARDDPGPSGPSGPFEVTLVGGPDAPAVARAAVAGWIADRVDEPTLADAQLLVGELVSSSVRDTDTPDGATISVRVELRGDAVHLEVQDGGTSGSIARPAGDPQHGGGLDLTLVEAISRRWGVVRGAGRRVWAEIAIRSGARGTAALRHPADAPRGAAEQRRAAAVAALTRADNARRRASVARQAGDRAGTEYARRSQYRVADLHAAIAGHHEGVARRLRLRDADANPDAACADRRRGDPPDVAAGRPPAPRRS